MYDPTKTTSFFSPTCCPALFTSLDFLSAGLNLMQILPPNFFYPCLSFPYLDFAFAHLPPLAIHLKPIRSHPSLLPLSSPFYSPPAALKPAALFAGPPPLRSTASLPPATLLAPLLFFVQTESQFEPVQTNERCPRSFKQP